MSPEFWMLLKSLSDLLSKVILLIVTIWVFIKIKDIEEELKHLKSGDKK